MENEDAYVYPEVNVWRSGSLATLPQDFMPCPYEQKSVRSMSRDSHAIKNFQVK